MRNNPDLPTSEIIAHAGRFTEFDEFIENTAAWDIDFRQLGRGDLNATLAQVVGKSWSLSRARFDQPAYQQGCAVPGMRTFALLSPLAPKTNWCGRPWSAGTVAAFAKDGEFRSISPAGFNVYTISFTEQRLAEACIRLDIPDVVPRLPSADSLLIGDSRLIGALRHLVDTTINVLCLADSSVNAANNRHSYRDEICDHLASLIPNSTTVSRRPSQRIRTLAVSRALQAIEDGLDQIVSVSELVRASGMSRRSLEYAFREHFDMSPKAFVNSQRLIRVRRDLRNRGDNAAIADVANRWGYWHLGQFARDYQRYFGELPSETRR